MEPRIWSHRKEATAEKLLEQEKQEKSRASLSHSVQSPASVFFLFFLSLFLSKLSQKTADVVSWEKETAGLSLPLF